CVRQAPVTQPNALRSVAYIVALCRVLREKNVGNCEGVFRVAGSRDLASELRHVFDESGGEPALGTRYSDRKLGLVSSVAALARHLDDTNTNTGDSDTVQKQQQQQQQEKQQEELQEQQQQQDDDGSVVLSLLAQSDCATVAAHLKWVLRELSPPMFSSRLLNFVAHLCDSRFACANDADTVSADGSSDGSNDGDGFSVSDQLRWNAEYEPSHAVFGTVSGDADLDFDALGWRTRDDVRLAAFFLNELRAAELYAPGRPNKDGVDDTTDDVGGATDGVNDTSDGDTASDERHVALDPDEAVLQANTLLHAKRPVRLAAVAAVLRVLQLVMQHGETTRMYAANLAIIFAQVWFGDSSDKSLVVTQLLLLRSAAILQQLEVLLAAEVERPDLDVRDLALVTWCNTCLEQHQQPLVANLQALQNGVGLVRLVNVLMAERHRTNRMRDRQRERARQAYHEKINNVPQSPLAADTDDDNDDDELFLGAFHETPDSATQCVDNVDIVLTHLLTAGVVLDLFDANKVVRGDIAELRAVVWALAQTHDEAARCADSLDAWAATVLPNRSAAACQ
ncbi:MAG: hypothetical protein MHM6MM_005621, partial [Cercozoa sp. M6MM]